MNWSRYSPETIQTLEQQLIARTGLPVTKQSIKIDSYRFIYTISCGDPSLPAMLLLHGYCGSGLVFFKILKQLSTRYYLILPDLLGMGRSTRPNFTHTSPEVCQAFFVQALQLFRVVIKLDQFVLVGHSFGGYISACYAILHPSRVRALLMLSPVGVPQQPDDYDYLDTLTTEYWLVRWVMKFVVFFWMKNITPISIFRKAGPVSNRLLDLYGHKKFLNLDKEEAQIVLRYLEQINLLHGSGEYAFYHLMFPGAWAKRPLCLRLRGLGIPMGFIYGENDWIKPFGAQELAANCKAHVQIKIVRNSGHHLYLDNPGDLAKTILRMLEKMGN